MPNFIFSKQYDFPTPSEKYGMFPVEEHLRHLAYIGSVKEMKALRDKYSKLDINAMDEYKQTPLYIAVKRRQVDMVKFLLNLPGINVNCQTLLGNSPMLMAAWNGDTALVKLLVEHKADVSLRTNPDREYHGGVSALDVAMEQNNHELIEYLRNLESQATPV